MKKSIYVRPQGIYDYKGQIANESYAHSLLKRIRWPDGVVCPRCHATSIWAMKGDYRCKKCQYHFSVLTGTLFEHSHLKVAQWIMAIGLFKIGVNALGLQ